MSLDCWFSVALPHGAVGWSAVCDCGISWSYSLTFSPGIQWGNVFIVRFERAKGGLSTD